MSDRTLRMVLGGERSLQTIVESPPLFRFANAFMIRDLATVPFPLQSPCLPIQAWPRLGHQRCLPGDLMR